MMLQHLLQRLVSHLNANIIALSSSITFYTVTKPLHQSFSTLASPFALQEDDTSIDAGMHCTATSIQQRASTWLVKTWVAHLHCNVAQTVISPICTCAGLEGDTTAVRLYVLTSRLCTWCRSANHPSVDTAAQ